ncbi:uncharacterized protein LOC114353922 [Ostrinia furnacalis]|uniref:uncharacterized protein LOC114353922 n=1 Tax=Ostrinia furnacalis TaxID=93504 RepID=UPI00103C92CE|nr:uncharacterized protein LOC114353922 [Ostrinia furnacalis]XP_028161900.1 uncharacterized protein LOC114353922 [Ostrinia furnacalis]XP_028161901.1 uncharacterized protein LOC114353922 [Ostrinia furnacalis]
MVFSQTSHKTRSLLKVVDIDHLKSNKEQQENGGGTTGVITGGNKEPLPQSLAPASSTSFSEEFLKPEPAYESTMYHESDYGFFQDLEQLCFDPAREEQVQTIDSIKVTKERAHNNDTLHTPYSPQDWETFGPNSPAQASMYCITPHDSLSPMADEFVQLDKLLPSIEVDTYDQNKYQEPTLDFNNMPVVFGDLVAERMADVGTVQVMDPDGWNLQHQEFSKQYTTTHNILPFIEEEETMDSRLVTVKPGELENDFTVSRFILGNELGEEADKKPEAEKRLGLSVSIPRTVAWAGDVISTPDIVTYVEQLEKEECPLLDTTSHSEWPTEVVELEPTSLSPAIKSPKMEYQPITPNSESQVESDNEEKPYSSSRKRRHSSEDSDYTPDVEYTPRNNKRKPKKPNIPIKDMIMALEGSQQLKKARRGRPPKRRESTVSTCSIDDTTSNVSTQEMKYRELRDKNNEASKRSRMNRKLKELQMEQLVLDLEDRNQKLKVKADILEEMTKKLKEALMTAILQK